MSDNDGVTKTTGVVSRNIQKDYCTQQRSGVTNNVIPLRTVDIAIHLLTFALAKCPSSKATIRPYIYHPDFTKGFMEIIEIKKLPPPIDERVQLAREKTGEKIGKKS